MNKNKSCVCNQCGRKMKIKIRQEVIDHEEDGEEVIEQFMACPVCNKRYTIFISDRSIREKMAARESLREKNRSCNPALDITLKTEIQQHLKELKKRYFRE